MILEKLLDGIEHKTQLPIDTEIEALTADSRKAAQGSLFCCVKGITSDGHDFAQAAQEAGAVILCERDLGLDRQILVDSTREAFAAVCENFFGNPLRKLKLIGVTGTNGKTSVTMLIKQTLEKCGVKAGLIGTIHNMIDDEVLETQYTTPDTFELHRLFSQMRDAGCGVCVMEVSSHALEQGRVAGLTFEVGCFTNLSQDHLDFHGTMEGYFAAKQKLFAHCRKAVVNFDDEWGQRLQIPENMIKYNFGMAGRDSGGKDSLSIAAVNPVYRPDGVEFRLIYGDGSASVRAATPGRFSVYNALAAAGCVLAIGGFGLNAVAHALSQATGIKGRAEVYPTGREFTVIIDYAHTPDGVENILAAMRDVQPKDSGRLICLIGCGGDRDPKKRPLMGEAAARLSDLVIITSDNPRSENPADIIEQILPGVEKHDTPSVVIENRRDAIEYAVTHAEKDDIIVLAGKGHETYQILGTGTIHFDEREVLAEIFAGMK